MRSLVCVRVRARVHVRGQPRVVVVVVVAVVVERRKEGRGQSYARREIRLERFPPPQRWKQTLQGERRRAAVERGTETDGRGEGKGTKRDDSGRK